jgi:S-adenosylmethionine decarboxylase
MIDVNVYQENIFHTKMMLKAFELDNYLFGVSEQDLDEAEKDRIKGDLRHEMAEMFYGQNMGSATASMPFESSGAKRASSDG